MAPVRKRIASQCRRSGVPVERRGIRAGRTDPEFSKGKGGCKVGSQRQGRESYPASLGSVEPLLIQLNG